MHSAAASGELKSPQPLNPSVRRHLDEANWSTLYPKSVRYTLYRVRERYWRRSDGENLAKGWSAEDITLQAIADVYDGTRTWDLNKQPDLLTFLKRSVIDSLVDGLARSHDNVLTARFPETMDADGVVEEPTNIATPEARHAADLVHHMPNPEELLEHTQETNKRAEQAKAIVGGLLEAAQDDKDVTAILECALEDVLEPRLVAARCGVPVERIYAAKKRLERMARKVREDVLASHVSQERSR